MGGSAVGGENKQREKREKLSSMTQSRNASTHPWAALRHIAKFGAGAKKIRICHV